jgi:hypothetical protein
MEGIENSRGIEIDSEISREIDGIEHKGTSQAGQDSDSIDIGADSEVWSPIFSPRKTRSGRVIDYKSQMQ